MFHQFILVILIKTLKGKRLLASKKANYIVFKFFYLSSSIYVYLKKLPRKLSYKLRISPI